MSLFLVLVPDYPFVSLFLWLSLFSSSPSCYQVVVTPSLLLLRVITDVFQGTLTTLHTTHYITRYTTHHTLHHITSSSLHIYRLSLSAPVANGPSLSLSPYLLTDLLLLRLIHLQAHLLHLAAACCFCFALLCPALVFRLSTCCPALATL